MSKSYKKAKDFPIGTRFIMERRVQYGMGGNELEKVAVTLVAYSKQGDEVVILEADDMDGTVYLQNVNDLLPENYIDPVVPFMEDILNMFNELSYDRVYQASTYIAKEINHRKVSVTNDIEGSVFELTITCVKRPEQNEFSQ